MFLEISQNSEKNICDRVSFLIKLHTSVLSCEICKNTFSYRTSPVVASGDNERATDIIKAFSALLTNLSRTFYCLLLFTTQVSEAAVCRCPSK